MAALTIARIQEIQRRQLPRRFGSEYQAAMRATRAEAPSCSKPSEGYSRELERYVQAMSTTETQVIPVALRYPKFIHLWDQHMLAIWPENHPFQSHSRAAGVQLPSAVGTVEIAEQLGKFKKHPRLWDADLGLFVPVPLLGDLLLFLVDDLGPYCVEWDAKRNQGDHGKPLRRAKNGWSPRSERIKAAFKDELRVAYFAELAIPIMRIHLNSFDETLRSNLLKMFRLNATPSSLHTELQLEIVEEFRVALPAERPPITTIAKFLKRGVPAAKVTEVLAQAIWDRRLEVDLFQLVESDLPLYPQRQDPYEVYRHFFQR